MTRVPKATIVAGVMSGTSADGVDVALVRVSPGVDGVPKLKVLGHRGFAYPKAVRAAVLGAMDAREISVAELSRLNWRLGEVYADCVERACAEIGVRVSDQPHDNARSARVIMGNPSGPRLALVGLHGQTIYHQARAEKFLGRPVRATWQTGEPAVVAERLRVTVVSDFRPADLAAGGQGAPLVPMLDYCLFRSKTKNRVLLNLGGIANVTAIPAGAGLDGVLAFDTGPANMVIDAVMQWAFGKPFDAGGRMGAKGKVLPGVLAELMRNPYFAAAPPKSCGREEFGAEYVSSVMSLCADGDPKDMVATATELTAASLLDAYARFCWPHLGQRAPLARTTELIVAGGGVGNATLMRRLAEGFGALGVKVLTSDAMGLGAQAKEAVAFALLAWLSWHGMAGNVPAATGASRGVVLGKVSLG